MLWALHRHRPAVHDPGGRQDEARQELTVCLVPHGHAVLPHGGLVLLRNILEQPPP